MDDFHVVLSGGRWDGLKVDLPFTADNVWLAPDVPVYHADKPIAGTNPLSQLVYAITAQRSADGRCIARLVPAPA